MKLFVLLFLAQISVVELVLVFTSLLSCIHLWKAGVHYQLIFLMGVSPT